MGDTLGCDKCWNVDTTGIYTLGCDKSMECGHNWDIYPEVSQEHGMWRQHILQMGYTLGCDKSIECGDNWDIYTLGCDKNMDC